MNIPEGESNDLFEGIFSAQTDVIVPVKDSNSSPVRFEPEPVILNKVCSTDDDTQKYARERLDDFFKSKIRTLLVDNEKIAISFPIYKLGGELYKILLVKENQGFYLSDEGTTIFELDKIFELSEPDVIKNLSAIMKQYGCRKKGQSITIDCTPDDVHIKYSYLIQCLSFMLNMKIFYI
jgi:hypothetical protein